MNEIDRLVNLLFSSEDGSHIVDLKFFPGEQDVTVEEFCREVHAAFMQVDSGQTKVSTTFPENLNPVDVDCFLAVAA